MDLDGVKIGPEGMAMLTMVVDGTVFTYVAPIGEGRDWRDMTLDEWRKYPMLSADAMLKGIVDDVREKMKGAGVPTDEGQPPACTNTSPNIPRKS